MADTLPSTVPSGRSAFGFFVGDHIDTWLLEGPALGLSPALTTPLSDRFTSYQAAARARVQADDAAAAALATLDAEEKGLRTETVGALQTIRAYAQTQPNPTAVYNAAKVAPPRPATPKPVPAAPSGLRARLLGTGDLEVDWKPVGGSTYAVQRKLTDSAGESTAFVDLVTDGARPFTDATVPAGTTTASYRIRARRSGKTGPWSGSADLLFVANPRAAAAPSALRIAA